MPGDDRVFDRVFLSRGRGSLHDDHRLRERVTQTTMAMALVSK